MAQTLQPGTPLQGGKYVIKQVLGQGGFGITYLATQVSLDRDVAIKEFFMRENCMRNDSSQAITVPSTGSAAQVEQFRKKFLKEARTLASLMHNHIIGVIDVFEENNTVYYSMPFMSKGSLKDEVKRQGHLREDMAMKYIHQIADALQYMHGEHHLCHYDVKPDNILIDRKGDAVLIDFGISKNYDANGNATSTTPIGISEGFAPVEQYQGIDGFSPASDVYALGATLYFLLEGKRPPTAINRVSGVNMDYPIAISKPLKDLIEQAMTISVKARPKDISIFLNDNTKPIKQPSSKTHGQPVRSGEEIEATLPQNNRVDSQTPEGTITASACSEEVIIVNSVPFTMVNVSGGKFMMGESIPEVKLSEYYIGKTQVTQELWQAVMGTNPSYFLGDLKCPVESVSWDMCQEFILKLNEQVGKMSGMRFRLPTEAEWEYAARGGDSSKQFLYAGGNEIDDVAWHEGNSGIKKKTWHGEQPINLRTHTVGKKKPNELGIYDMSGNVWEWCQDWYGPLQTKTQINPIGPESGIFRVVRGGCWVVKSRDCRISNRFYFNPSNTNFCVGLRLAASSL